MNYATYLLTTLIFYGCIVALAMALGDISVVIDIVSAYCISCLAFFIPSTFYKKAVELYGEEIKDDKDTKSKFCTANIFLPLGCLNAILGISSAVLGVLGLTEGGH